MENLPQIKWHAQELHKLLEQEPNNAILANLYVELERAILNNSRFKGVEAAPPEQIET